VVANQHLGEGHHGHPSPLLSLRLVHRHQGPVSSSGLYQQGHHGGGFQQQRTPPCPHCGKMQLGICYIDLPICYGFGLRGHILRDCRSSRQCEGRGMAHPSSSAATTSVSPPPARDTPTPTGRCAARGGT